MKKQNYNNLKVSVNCFTAEHYSGKKALVNLLLLNTAARSDMVDREQYDTSLKGCWRWE